MPTVKEEYVQLANQLADAAAKITTQARGLCIAASRPVHREWLKACACVAFISSGSRCCARMRIEAPGDPATRVIRGL